MHKKIRNLSKLLQQGIEFHGHSGPFLVIGLRMGIYALLYLDADGWFDLKCHLNLQWKPPDSCVIDGIQIATGCTMGKHNIDVEPGEGVSAIFNKDHVKLKISLKKDVFEMIKVALKKNDEKEINTITFNIEKLKDNQLFDIARL
jgi:formylmethanofuran dehydrogenase subunit E